MTSLTLGTGRKRLWLLRSRPDQIGRATMRGGPSGKDSTRVDAPTEALFSPDCLRHAPGKGICLMGRCAQALAISVNMTANCNDASY